MQRRGWIVGGLVAGALALASWANPGVASMAPTPGASFDDEDEDDEPRWFAAVGGDVHTSTGGLMRGASVLSKDGKIHSIGYDLDLPEGTEVVSADGLHVYPGLVAYSSNGLVGGSSDFEATSDPFNYRMVLALASGITTTGQSSSALKLKRFEIDGILMRSGHLSSQTYSDSSASTKRNLKEKFAKAAAYLEEFRLYEIEKKDNKDLKEPSKKGIDSGALAILRGETLALFRSDRRGELLGIARIAQQYGFRPVIQGCLEGWTVAGELGRAGAYAVLTPRRRQSKSEAQLLDGGSSIENAAILHAHGVQVAVIPSSTGVDLGGIVGRDIMHLPVEAGFAVRGGLSEQAALEAITTIPARILGVSHRVGSIEVGKDCDLLITDGDILHYETFVQTAVVEGKVVYEKGEEMYFAHIRPQPEGDADGDSGEHGDEDGEVEDHDEDEGDDEGDYD